MTTPEPFAPDPYLPPQTTVWAQPQPLTPAMPPEFVGFRRRFVARLIDTLVHILAGFLGGILTGIAAAVYAARVETTIEAAIPLVQPSSVAGFVLGLLGSFLFQTTCESVHGSSPGKLLCGLVVLQESLLPCSFSAAVKRDIAYFFDSLLFGIVAHSYMSKSEKQQRAGDQWARTVVVRRRSAPKSSLRSGLRFCLGFAAAFFIDAFVMAAPAIVSAIAA